MMTSPPEPPTQPNESAKRTGDQDGVTPTPEDRSGPTETNPTPHTGVSTPKGDRRTVPPDPPTTSIDLTGPGQPYIDTPAWPTRNPHLRIVQVGDGHWQLAHTRSGLVIGGGGMGPCWPSYYAADELATELAPLDFGMDSARLNYHPATQTAITAALERVYARYGNPHDQPAEPAPAQPAQPVDPDLAEAVEAAIERNRQRRGHPQDHADAAHQRSILAANVGQLTPETAAQLAATFGNPHLEPTAVITERYRKALETVGAPPLDDDIPPPDAGTAAVFHNWTTPDGEEDLASWNIPGRNIRSNRRGWRPFTRIADFLGARGPRP